MLHSSWTTYILNPGESLFDVITREEDSDAYVNRLLMTSSMTSEKQPQQIKSGGKKRISASPFFVGGHVQRRFSDHRRHSSKRRHSSRSHSSRRGRVLF